MSLSAEMWQSKESFSLKRNQFYQNFYTDGDRKKRFYFRWVMYKNEGLFVHLNYDGFNRQFILYRNYAQNSFRLDLTPNQNYRSDSSFLMLEFADFSDDNATFNLYKR
jgi:hypothetical protein